MYTIDTQINAHSVRDDTGHQLFSIVDHAMPIEQQDGSAAADAIDALGERHIEPRPAGCRARRDTTLPIGTSNPGLCRHPIWLPNSKMCGGERRRHGRTDSRASSPPVARPRPPFRDDPCAIGSEIDTHGPGPFDRDATGISYCHRAQNSSDSHTYNADGPEIPIMDATSSRPGMELAAPARVVARAPAAEPAINASRILLPSSNPAMR